MYEMFVACSDLTSLDLSSFDTHNVTNMGEMFCWDRRLESLDLSNFDTTNVTSYFHMFYDCSSLKYIKCRYAFKEWCDKNKSSLGLTDYWDNITWSIVDVIPETKTYIESSIEKNTYTIGIGVSGVVPITHTYSY
jgi:surface protein